MSNHPSHPRHRSSERWLTAVAALLLLILVVLRPGHAAVPTGDPPPPVIKVQITGVEGKALENVQSHLMTQRLEKDPPRSPERIRMFHRKATARVQEALKPFGYYHAQVDADLQETSDGWIMRYTVRPGPPVLVQEVTIRIDGDARSDDVFHEAVRTSGMRPGHILDQTAYEETKKELQRLALERGYFLAKLSRHEIRLNLATNQAWVDLTLESGPRHRFGPVQFIQSDGKPLDPAFLARFQTFQEGEPYTLEALLAMQEALSATPYFQQVEVQTQPEHAAQDHVPIQIVTRARPANRYTAGAGYGTDTGPRVRLGYERRYINPQGHRFRTELSASTIHKGLSAHYDIPLENARTDQLSFNAAWRDQQTDTAESEMFSLGTVRSGMRWGWREALGLEYQLEESQVAHQELSNNLLLGSASWSKTMRDDPNFTRKGWHTQIGVKGASSALLSDTDVLQLHLNQRLIRPIGQSGRLLLGGELGTSVVNDFDNLPVSLRFFAGGDSRMRGYAFNRLGPKNEEGEVTGGRHLVLGSVEYEQLIKEKWGAAVFYDVGNAFDNFDESLIKHAAGVGVRWYSPVGPIRVDAAKPIDDPDKSSIQFHFAIGADM